MFFVWDLLKSFHIHLFFMFCLKVFITLTTFNRCKLTSSIRLANEFCSPKKCPVKLILTSNLLKWYLWKIKNEIIFSFLSSRPCCMPLWNEFAFWFKCAFTFQWSSMVYSLNRVWKARALWATVKVNVHFQKSNKKNWKKNQNSNDKIKWKISIFVGI